MRCCLNNSARGESPWQFFTVFTKFLSCFGTGLRLIGQKGLLKTNGGIPMELVMEIVLEEKSISSQVRARASLLRRPVQSRKKGKKPKGESRFWQMIFTISSLGAVRFPFLRLLGRRTEVTGLYWAAPEQMAWSKIMR